VHAKTAFAAYTFTAHALYAKFTFDIDGPISPFSLSWSLPDCSLSWCLPTCSLKWLHLPCDPQTTEKEQGLSSSACELSTRDHVDQRLGTGHKLGGVVFGSEVAVSAKSPSVVPLVAAGTSWQTECQPCKLEGDRQTTVTGVLGYAVRAIPVTEGGFTTAAVPTAAWRTGSSELVR